jgi:threonine/homoserine/homoserine lactone efflux protein
VAARQTLPLQIVALTAISVVITLVAVSCWTFFGAFMRRYLQTERRRRWFNYTMAALLVLSILPVLWE